MRAFAIFTGLIALGLAGIAFLGYPAWLLISPFLDNPKFHRISSRVGMALLTIGFIVVVRRLKMADRQSLGFGLPTGEFIAQVFKALGFGIVLMMPALVTMLLLDMRQLVGEPLSGQGKPHPLAKAMRAFCRELTQRYGLQVHRMHEGYSSREARSQLVEARARGERG